MSQSAAILDAAGKVIPVVIDIIGKIIEAANRTVIVVNNDDHPIWIEFCQKNDRRGPKLVQPGEGTRIDFVPNVSTLWWVDAWFNGTDKAPFPFQVWEGHGRSVRYMIEKDDGIYKAWIDGSNRHMHIKFNVS